MNKIIVQIENTINILQKEFFALTFDSIIYIAINGGIIFLFFYFISNFFKAYILRLLLFTLGVYIFLKSLISGNILQNFDFYSGLALFLPHTKIIEITYVVLKENTLFVYNQLVGLILLLVSPLVWLYRQIARLSDYLKAKQGERADKKAYEEYYKDENQNDFRQQQKAEWEKEQARQDEKSQREFREREAKREQQKQEQQRRYEEEKKQYQQSKQTKDKKPSSRWESTNPYEVLGLEETATKSEIKKAYRKLAKLYHPDLALVNKEKAEEIFKMINRAYENLT